MTVDTDLFDFQDSVIVKARIQVGGGKNNSPAVRPSARSFESTHFLDS